MTKMMEESLSTKYILHILAKGSDAVYKAAGNLVSRNFVLMDRVLRSDILWQNDTCASEIFNLVARTIDCQGASILSSHETASILFAGLNGTTDERLKVRQAACRAISSLLTAHQQGGPVPMGLQEVSVKILNKAVLRRPSTQGEEADGRLSIIQAFSNRVKEICRSTLTNSQEKSATYRNVIGIWSIVATLLGKFRPGMHMVQTLLTAYGIISQNRDVRRNSSLSEYLLASWNVAISAIVSEPEALENPKLLALARTPFHNLLERVGQVQRDPKKTTRLLELACKGYTSYFGHLFAILENHWIDCSSRKVEVLDSIWETEVRPFIDQISRYSGQCALGRMFGGLLGDGQETGQAAPSAELSSDIIAPRQSSHIDRRWIRSRVDRILATFSDLDGCTKSSLAHSMLLAILRLINREVPWHAENKGSIYRLLAAMASCPDSKEEVRDALEVVKSSLPLDLVVEGSELRGESSVVPLNEQIAHLIALRYCQWMVKELAR